MTATQIAVRKNLYRRFRALSDKDAEQVIRYIDTHESHEPNEETIKAFEESLDPANLIGPFSNVEDLIASLLADDDAQFLL